MHTIMTVTAHRDKGMMSEAHDLLYSLTGAFYYHCIHGFVFECIDRINSGHESLSK